LERSQAQCQSNRLAITWYQPAERLIKGEDGPVQSPLISFSGIILKAKSSIEA
jgi:hypothetical protein